MAGENVLKDFLVAIGISVDDVGQRKALDALRTVEVQAKVVADAFEEAAIKVLQFASKIASGLEASVYQSQRLKSSAGDVKAFAYAISQLGGTADGATSSMENLGRKLRENPGYGGWLRQLGVQGDTRNVTNDMEQLANIFAKMDHEGRYFQALQFSERLGIDEPTLRAMISDVTRFTVEYKAKLKEAGLDPDKAAENGRILERVYRSFAASVEIAFQKVGAAVAVSLSGPLHDFTTFIDRNSDRLSTAISQIATSLLAVAQKFTAWIASDDGKHAIDALTNPKVWESFEKTLYGVADALGLVLSRLSALFNGPLGKLVMGKYGLGITNDGLGDAVGAVAAEADPENEGGSAVGRFWRKHAPTWLGGAPPGGKRNLTRPEQRANAAAFADELRKAGLPPEGVAAVMGSGDTESSWNPRAYNGVRGGHTGHIQWDATRWPKIKAWIEQQGGDPYDSRWQARAFVAEGRAKPGDAIYDTPRTAEGFRMLERSAGDLGAAVKGMENIERFGPGEEGGRAAKAREYLQNPVAAATPAPSTSAHTGGPVPMPTNITPFPSDAHPFHLNTDTSASALGSSTTTTNNITINQGDTHVQGVNDPKKAADHVSRAGQGQWNTMLANLGTAIG